MIVTADGRLPSFGTLDRLTPQQDNYVQHLINDLKKIARAKDLAHADAAATGNDSVGTKHVQEMTRKVAAHVAYTAVVPIMCMCGTTMRHTDTDQLTERPCERVRDEGPRARVSRNRVLIL
jgi:hypothetical protein